MSQQEIIQLLDRYLAGTATPPEQERVEAWLDSNEDLNNDWQHMDETQRTDFLSNLYQRILISIGEEGRKERKGYAKNAKVVSFYKTRAFKWIAAASVILIASLIVILSLTKNGNVGTPPVATTNDVEAPKETRAVITLADGRKVYLDSANNGTIAQENNVSVVKNNNGEIVYNSTAQPLNNSTQYNTLFNPRGSKVISLTLSDGTKVWLNSESSLRYPASFAPSAVTREVEITGEAYFEVAHNASKPFHVKKGETDVTVLGTHFNVNAYNDEDALRVTLLEGSVQVSLRNSASSALSAVKIKPGEQAVINQANPSISRIEVQTVDANATTAWVTGYFQFENTDVKTMMRQVARWYDVDVEYRGEVSKTFGGKIPRTMSAKNVFRVLEETGGVHFKIEGKKVIVLN
jgi:transmembrane sensor